MRIFENVVNLLCREGDWLERLLGRLDLGHIVSGDVHRPKLATVFEKDLYSPHAHPVLVPGLDLFDQRSWKSDCRPPWQLSRSVAVTGHPHRGIAVETPAPPCPETTAPSVSRKT
jgi:hypothetical protein